MKRSGKQSLGYQPMKTRITQPILLILLLVLLGFTACSQKPTLQVIRVPLKTTVPGTATETLLPMTSSSTIKPSTTFSPLPEKTSTPLPTNTPSIIPSDTPTQSPSPTETQTNTLQPAVPITNVNGDNIVFYLVHLDTGGPYGCGDNLIPIRTGKTRTGNLDSDVQIAIDALFSTGQYSMSLYNATYPSKLKFSGLQLSKGEAIVDLKGTYVKPANACDASRYRAQVWTTIQQFPEIQRAIPKYKGALLGDLLYIYSDGKD